jgi:DNA-binding transcriptional LysR family regulator
MDRLDCDRMFVAVLETGSFARAAGRLRVSSGQASKLVRRLEQQLGVQLLNRTTRALAATEAGQAYFDQIRRIIADFDALDGAVKSRSAEATGRLRITAPLSFGQTQLVPLLLEFAALHPRIDLDVRFSDRVVDLVNEGFDAGIRIGTLSDVTLIARRLTGARIVVAASRGYLAKAGTPQHPADLAGHACIIDTNFSEPALWAFSEPAGGARQTVAVRGRLHLSSADACAQAAVQGFGIVRSPSFIAGPHIASGSLQPVLVAFEDVAFGIHVVYPPTRHLASKVRVLVDFLVSRFKGTPPWDHGL